jgi:hypothetical protein
MILFTIHIEDREPDPGDLAIDPNEVFAVVEHEKDGVPVAILCCSSGSRFCVYDTDRSAQSRVAAARGDTLYA